MEQEEDLIKSVIELREALKIYDQRLVQLKGALSLIEQNGMERNKEIKSALQNMSAQMTSHTNKIVELQDMVGRLEKQSEQYAKIQDVKVIDRYLSLIDPSRFLSKEDVIKIVEEYMGGKKWS